MPRLQTPTANCPSLVRITIIDRTPTEVTESNSDVYIFKREDSKTDEEPTSDGVSLNCINQISSTHLSIIKCVSFPPAEKDDWRKMSPSIRSPNLEIRIVR